MSKSIDQKIVEMQFDNKNFEKNAAESMGTIDKLKQKLDFSNEGKSFQELEKKAGKTDFKDFKDNVDKVSVKFDAMQVAAITALTNITNKVVDTGIQLVKSLSTDQIAAGWEKFGEMTVNTGTLISQDFDIDEVNEQLDKLLWFTDETSYNFTDMVSSISKFTGAGQGLTESVDAMQGIALWAAKSGQNAATASRVMYQLSQAMGSGVIKLQDWQSILTANMATQEFKQKALDAAVQRGTLQRLEDGYYISLIEDLEHEAEEFNINQFSTQLTSGLWFTSDVLMDVLGEYSAAVEDIYAKAEETGMTASEVMDEFGDTLDEFGLKAFQAGQEARTFEDVLNSVKDAVSTGYMNIFKDVFGAYDEAKVFWTDLANAAWDVFAGPVDEKHQKLSAGLGTSMYDVSELKDWSEMYLDSKTDVLEEISDAFTDFDHYTARTLGKRLMYTNENGELVARTGSNVKKIVEYARQYGKDSEEFQKMVEEWTNGDAELKEALYDYVSVQGSGYASESQIMWVLAQNAGVAKTEIEQLYSIVNEEGLDSDSAKEYINTLAKGDEKLQKFITDYVDSTARVVTATTGRQNLVEAFWELWDGIANIVDHVKQAFRNVFPESQWSNVYAWTVKIRDGIKNILPKEETLQKFQTFLEGVFTVFKEIGEVLKAIFSPFIDKIKELFSKSSEDSGGLLDSLTNLGESVKKGFDDFKNGDFLKTVSEVSQWVADKLSWLAETIGKALTFIKDKIIGFFTDKSVVSFKEETGELLDVDSKGTLVKTTITCFEDFVNKLQNIGNWIADKFQKIKDTIVNFFNTPLITKTNEDGSEEYFSRMELIKAKLDDFTEWASNAWENIKNFASNVKDGFNNSQVHAAISDFWNKLKERIDEIKSYTKQNISTEEGDEENLDPSPITSFLDKIHDFFSKIHEKASAFYEEIKPIFDAIGNIFKGIKDFLVNIWEQFIRPFFVWLSQVDIGTILTEGFTVGAFAGAGAAGFQSIYNLYWFVQQLVDTFELLGEGFSTLAKVSYVFDGIYSKLMLEGISALLKAIGQALLEIAAAMLIFSYIESDKMEASVAAVGGILTVLVMLAMVLYKHSDATAQAKGLLNKTAGTLRAIAVLLVGLSTAVLEIAIAVKKIADIGDTEKIVVATLMIEAILGSLVGAVEIMNHTMKPSSVKSAIGTAVEMAELANAVKKIVKSVKLMSEVGDTETMITATIAVSAILLELAIAMEIMNSTDSKGGVSKAIELAAFTMALSGAINGVKTLADIAAGGHLLESVIALGAVIAEMALLMYIPVDGKKAIAMSGAIGIMATALLLLLPVIYAFAGMKTEELEQAIIAVGAISLILGGISALMSVTGGTGALAAGGGIALLAFGILEMALALKILADCAPALAAGAPLIAQSVVDIAEVIITALPNLVGKLADSIAEAGPKLIQMFVTLIQSACTGILDSLDSIVSTIIQIIFTVLDAVKDNIGPIIEKIIGIVVGAIQGVAAGTAEIVTALVDLFKAIFEALSGVMGDDLDLEKMLEAVAFLSALFVAMTAITLISLEALATIAILNQIADQLNIFMEKIQPFIKAAKTIDPTSMEGVKILAETILLLTASSILEGLTSWLTGGVDYTKFAEGLNEMAPSIKNFADQMAEVDGENLKNAAQAALYLAQFVDNLPRSGGLLQSIIGETTDLKTFAEGLIDLAPALVDYAHKVKELTPEDITALQESIKAVKALADMANNLPRHGGLWQKIIGEAQTMTEFAEDMKPLPGALINYAEEAKKLSDEDIEAIKRSIPAVKGISDMAKELPKHGGVVQWFLGDNTLTDFATELSDFAPELVKYAHQVKNLTPKDIEAVANSVDAATGLVGVANALNPSGGVFSWFTGETDFEKFSTDIVNIGTGLKGYSDAIKGIANKRVKDSVESAQALVDIANSLDPQGGIKSWFEGDANLETFGVNVENFGKSLKNYSDTVAQMDVAGITNSSQAVTGLVSLLTVLKTATGNFDISAVKSFGDTLPGFGSSIKSYTDIMKTVITSDIDGAIADVKDLIDGLAAISTDSVAKIETLSNALGRLAEDGVKKFLSEFDNAGERAKTSGANFIQNFIDGAEGKRESLKLSAETLSSALITKFTSLTVDYEEAGEAMVLDIANGINKARQQSENLNPIGTYATDLQTTFTIAINDIDFYAVGEAVITTFCTAVSESGQYVSASFGSTEEGLVQGVADIKTYYTSFYDAGYYLVDGFKQGIDERSKAIEESASNLGGRAFAALKSALKEHSPSRLTYQVGQYFTQGFAEGIAADVYYVERSINYISDQAAEEMSSIISNLGSQLDDDIDDHLTITPVLDLTEFQAGTKVMDDYFSQMSRSRVGATAAYDSMANRATPQSMHDAMMNKLDSLEPSAAGESINNNNFYIQSNDPREVATEVSRILQKQVERRNSVWE